MSGDSYTKLDDVASPWFCCSPCTSRARRLRHSTSDALAVALAALHGQALREWRGAKTGKETTKSIILVVLAGS